MTDQDKFDPEAPIVSFSLVLRFADGRTQTIQSPYGAEIGDYECVHEQGIDDVGGIRFHADWKPPAEPKP